ncbi:aminotransferase class V-fold PLP-dependent enzyme [Polynucleobacter sp. IMCC30063]|uniref:aminotransferase class V-fold PLP-dependent enzyme n=1 Tax=unclassified Polynucleobacter TaxID=2640945 RepID=UPI001F483505|nr:MULTISPECIES: aminotransferase class V-fold PLP-dependent enzyme [unclassified Polynucleobacter]MCE7506462.1 aminotransferase class V-fold PLP-dependent enzyme [Polynucleobacter sp. IMCC30063]MCE7527734.1 aminotransferase class V-fold PLP-dependent enzyme [Polynucleobacter sp. IMCC 30228]MCE7529552.1 aminotransferase class V-fold PLP-dependent enzyme [Polynucleobacter sp. IMCC 29146]
MPGLLPNVDPAGLLEFSVVYTDRSLNHMSHDFGQVMRDISRIFKCAYQAHSTVIVPGSGTFGMESVARQFAVNQKCFILRNGWFSYRWTQIFEMAQITTDLQVLKARQVADQIDGAFMPAPIDQVVALILKEKPAVVFAPHVETSAGLMLSDAYLTAVGKAVQAVGGLFVLDCIASGAMWVDMKACNVDILISAPQKGWSGPPCCALIGMSERARQKIETTQSNSFALDLKKWLVTMETYEKGAHVYHATMPTDTLRLVRNVMQETQALGFANLQAKQIELGAKIRALMVANGFSSVAAEGFQAPAVVVSYTTDPEIQNGKKFMALGMQTAAGVPLQCDERSDFRTFRVGLFGLEKLQHIERTVAHLESAIEQVRAVEQLTTAPA